MGVDQIARTEVVERGGIAGEHCPIAPILKSFDFVDHSVVFRQVVERRVPIGRVRYDQIANANAIRQESLSIVTAITARSALEVSVSRMGGDNLIPKHLCPGCGRAMGLTRTVPASPGYRELRTYGCIECGVWVTEGRAPRDEREDSFILRE